MKHFDSCRCAQCRQKLPPPAHTPGCGFLMQQIIASGQQNLRCEPFCLTTGPLPRNLIPPLSVSCVAVSGTVRVQEAEPSCCGGQTTAVIPLSVTLRDSRGQTHVTTSEISVPVPLRLPARSNGQNAQYVANAAVHLSHPTPCTDVTQPLSVTLDVCVQVFLVQLRPMYAPAPCAPACPDLPLYPPPCSCRPR